MCVPSAAEVFGGQVLELGTLSFLEKAELFWQMNPGGGMIQQYENRNLPPASSRLRLPAGVAGRPGGFHA